MPIPAAGFVLHRPGPGRFLYLLLTNARHGDVGLPKGHADEGEDALGTALREAEEETGLPRDAVAPVRGFRRAVRYAVKGRTKEVTYLAARAARAEVRLSKEHSSFAWLDLDEALGAVRHENLRGVLRDAAAFLKDPILRRGLDPAGARALLAREAGGGAPVLAHAEQVADMARTMAGALRLDADYVEAAAWLHDVGRARTQETRHTVEGFRLLAGRGHPGYAPPCLSHYLKGRSPEEVAEPDLAREMRECCDLDTFPPEERVIALADFLAVGGRRVRPEERHADLVRRYGASPFVDGSLAIARDLRREVEEGAGAPLDALLGL